MDIEAFTKFYEAESTRLLSEYAKYAPYSIFSKQAPPEAKEAVNQAKL